MKRKLIEFDVFERIKKDSLSNAQRELEEASLYLAKALNLESVELNCYGSEDVIYESVDGTYVHANYKLDNGFIEFDNIQELIINEESERAISHQTLSEMLDCLIESKEKEAEDLFAEWAEEDLSKLIGDAPAHFAVAQGKKIASAGKAAAIDLLQNTVEYLSEEKKVLLNQRDFVIHKNQLMELRDAVERLDKRIALLQQRNK